MKYRGMAEAYCMCWWETYLGKCRGSKKMCRNNTTDVQSVQQLQNKGDDMSKGF